MAAVIGLFLLFILRRFDRPAKLVPTTHAPEDSKIYEHAIELEPNISATAGHNEILARGRWVKDLRKRETALSVEQIQKRLDQKIHDLLSLGKLTAWGRPGIPGRAQTGPLTEIPKEKWAKIEIVFNERRSQGDTTKYLGGIGNTPYYEVHFCAEQLYSLFPLETELEGAPAKITTPADIANKM